MSYRKRYKNPGETGPIGVQAKSEPTVRITESHGSSGHFGARPVLLAELACDADGRGNCAECGGRLWPGQRIARVIGGGWSHVSPCIGQLVPHRR